MRRSSVLLSLAVFAAFAGVGVFLYRHLQRERSWRELTKLEGQALARDTRVAERAAHLLDRHLGPDPNLTTWPQAAPFFVVSAEGLLLVFQCFTETSMDAEPAPRGTVFVFDAGGRLKRSEAFSFGWSLFPGVPRVSEDPALRRDVIDFRCSGTGPVARQVYVLGSGPLDLVRLEDAGGAAIPNRYDGHSAGVGPKEIRIRQYGEDLYSNDPCDVLASLVWLGGKHWTPAEVPSSRAADDHFQAALVAKLRQDPKVRSRIAELTASQIPWIREAAALAQSALPKDK